MGCGNWALAAVGTIVGSFFGYPGLGFTLGMVAGNFLFPTKTGSQSVQQDTPNYSANNGFGVTTGTTQVPVPVCFGTVMLDGNIIEAYNLGEGNSRLLCVLALGEYTGEPDPSLLNLWVDGIEFTKLSNYSASRANKKSWYEFYPTGARTTINVSNLGTKGIGQVLDANGESHTSYAIEILGEPAAVDVHLNHYSKEAGSTQNWKIEYKQEGAAEFTELGSYSQTFRKSVEYEQPSGCSSETITEYVEGYTRTTHSFSGLPAGTLYFKVTLISVTNQGNLLWEDVKITADEGRVLTIHYPYTTYLLINLVKGDTDEISSATFKALAAWKNSNAADAVKYIMQDSELGLGITTEIDQPSFDAAAAWCSANGRLIGGAFIGAAYDQTIRMILDAAGLFLVKTGGRYKLLPDRDDESRATFTLGENILPGTFTWGMIDQQDRFNSLRVKYADSQEDYTQQDVLVADPAIVDSDNYVAESTLDLSLINDQAVAQLRGEECYKKAQLSEVWCNFSIGLQDARVEPGDIVTVVNPSIGWTSVVARKFRIAALDEIEEEQGRFGYQLQCVHHVPESYVKDYAWHDWHPEVLEFPIDIPVMPQVFIDSIVQAAYLSSGVWRVRLTIAWTPPEEDSFDHIELWSRPEYDANYSYISRDDSGTVRFEVPETYITWWFKLMAVSKDGTKQEIDQAPARAYYPTTAPHKYPGWGGGRWGRQPWGA